MGTNHSHRLSNHRANVMVMTAMIITSETVSRDNISKSLRTV